MAITYDWQVNYADVKATEDDLSNVCISCRWSVSATDDSTDPATTASSYSYATFGAPDPSSFIDFDNLTQETVLGWIYDSGVDKDAVEAGLVSQIDQIKNPPTTQRVIPA
jgi:hypothetical protein